MTRPAIDRRTVGLYLTVVGLFVLVLGWWLVFFSQRGEAIVEDLAREGVVLTPEQVEVVREGADAEVRMLLYEGAFLVLLLIAGVWLTIRSMRAEVRLHRQRRDMLSAVTHELKSPIASARLHAESLVLDTVPPEKRDRYLMSICDELTRLNDMVDRLLDSARASSGRFEVEAVDVELAEVAARRVERFRSREDQRATFTVVESDEPVTVRGDAEAIDTILQNLLSNACKYGGDTPRVEVAVRRRGEHGVLQVRDHGEGARDVDPAALFEPFVRGGDELVRQRPGAGLGLFVVAELVKALGGDVRAQHPSDGPGFAVEVSLPLAEGDA